MRFYEAKIKKHLIHCRNIASVEKLLRKNNIVCILVGGFIRNILCNIKCKNDDIDIECYFTSMEKLQSIISKKYKTIMVGISFGVIKIPKLNIDISVPRLDRCIGIKHTSFTIQTPIYIDYKSSSFRRDITINSIGYMVKYNKILDPYNGIRDIRKKVIRPIDSKRFLEDPLRILRSIYFCSKLTFNISDCLHKVILENHHLIQNVSKERIANEILKILKYININIDTVFMYMSILKNENTNFAHTIYEMKNKNIIYKIILKLKCINQKIAIISIFDETILNSISGGIGINKFAINTIYILSKVVKGILFKKHNIVIDNILRSHKLQCHSLVLKYSTDILKTINWTYTNQLLDLNCKVSYFMQITSPKYLIDINPKFNLKTIVKVKEKILELIKQNIQVDLNTIKIVLQDTT